MVININYATDSDVKELFNIAKFFHLKSRLIDDFENPEINHIDNPNWCIIVARSDNLEMVGYAVGCIWGHKTDINFNMFDGKKTGTLEEVHVTLHRKGIGTLLVKKFEEWSKFKGCQICDLSGGPVPEFYESLNYKRIGAAYHYYKTL